MNEWMDNRNESNKKVNSNIVKTSIAFPLLDEHFWYGINGWKRWNQSFVLLIAWN